MKSVPVVSEIGFSDSEIESYRKESDVVQVVLKGWNEGRIQVAFTSVIRLLDSDASGVHELQEYVENTEFLQSARERTVNHTLTPPVE